MSENRSEILKFQDKNNDGIHDDCPETEFKEIKKCPDCIPDPNALVENWRKKLSGDAWFNEKYCTYQITITTAATSLLPSTFDINVNYSDEQMDEFSKEVTSNLFDEYKVEAASNLLDEFDKENTETTRNQIIESFEYSKYDIDPRPRSHVKLLYTVPFKVFAEIGDSIDDSEESEEMGDTTVRFVASEMPARIERFTRAMHLYSRYYRVYNAMQGSCFVFTEGSRAGKVFTKGQFDKYGGGLNRNDGIVRRMLNDLDTWLNRKNMNIVGYGGYRGGVNNPNRAVTEIQFVFNEKYKLKELKVWAQGCGEPKTYNEGQLKSLNKRASWKDSTGCAYFSKQKEIDFDLRARVAMTWDKFVAKHTWPAIESKFEYGSNKSTKKKDSKTVLSCVGDALESEAKQFGQDIVDDVFSIGDSIAAMFQKNMCKDTWDEALEEGVKLGYIWDPESKTQKNVVSMAKEQAFKQLYQDEQLFTRMCAKFLDNKLQGSNLFSPMKADPQKKLITIFDPIEQMKQCGLFDLIIQAVECLMKGFSLEEALRAMIQSALSNMSVENFGKFFYGLPEDKQAEVARKVKAELYASVGQSHHSTAELKRQIENGTPPPGVPLLGQIKVVAPWDDEAVLEAERRKLSGQPEDERRTLPEPTYKPISQGGYGGSYVDKNSQQKSVAKGSDQGVEFSFALGMDPSIILRAYLTAILEVFKDDYLELMDELDKYPGVRKTKQLLAALECPHPPLFEPSLMDFIKSIQLPFCRDINDITLPGMNNPFDWIPDLWDLLKLLFEVAKMVVMQLIMTIIQKFIVKLCQLIGDAICKALEAAGAAIGALATCGYNAVIGNEVESDCGVGAAVRKAICGPDASQNKVEDTLVDIFDKLGAGGAALADREGTLNFMRDLSAATTPVELNEALTGQPSSAFLNVADSLLEFEYPQFREALSGPDDITDFFGSVGNLFPASVKSALQDTINSMPEASEIPSNPSLCASPKAIEDFKELRCELLAGRASPADCRKMYDNIQAENMEDLEDILSLAEKGVPKMFEDSMPPLISTPGCDDGLLPYEPEVAAKAATVGLNNNLKNIQINFTKDMIGQGGFFTGDASWGMLNMILSDTGGKPLSTHRRDSSRSVVKVDFNEGPTEPLDAENLWSVISGDSPVPLEMQKNAYPTYVGYWLKQQMQEAAGSLNFSSNNTYLASKSFYKPLSAASRDAYDPLSGVSFLNTNSDRETKTNTLRLPDYGYNTIYGIDMPSKSIKITRLGRKGNPDLYMKFSNGRRGRVQHKNAKSTWGYQLNLYLSDLRDENNEPYNVFVDSARVKIIEQINLGAIFGEDSTVNIRKYEFISVDSTLDLHDTTPYLKFQDAFINKQQYLPQLWLLHDMIKTENPNVGERLRIRDIKTFYDSYLADVTSKIMLEVSENEAAWKYGAKFDDLTSDDVKYVVKPGQADQPGGTLYSKATINGEKIDNDMGILGYSKMQYEEEVNGSNRKNRVTFLDPSQNGGSYVIPPVYIEPMKNEGWLGLADVIFAPPSPKGCKGVRKDLVDFEEISKQVEDAYNSIPEDQRLKYGDCAEETPYNRILLRPSKAGIQGIITATCRIFASVHFVKTMPTFATFEPKFNQNYSSLYATYIVEAMEKSLKDAQNDIRESFNSFKDYEFWYAFLEQSVQTYGRLVKEGTIDAPAHVLRAMQKINDVQEGYYVRKPKDLFKDILNGAETFGTSFSEYDLKHSLLAVQRTEEYAKLVLKEMVITELNSMSDKFVENMTGIGLTPKYHDLDFYIMQHMANGGESLTLDRPPEQLSVDLPTQGNNLYTNGGELSRQPSGEDYVGYYHIHEDEDGNRRYMEGAYHKNEAHGELTVYALKTEVSVGNVAELNAAGGSVAKPIIIEKYISINDTKYRTTAGYEIVTKNDGAKTLHEVYPGTMRTITENVPNIETGEMEEKTIGITGKMGVRYGLQLSININGAKYPLTSVEVDALDLPISQFKKLEANSSELLCLLNLLKEDSKYQLLTRYVIPFSKITATTAIYNDYGLLPSIGEYTAPPGATSEGTLRDKPGIGVELNEDGEVIQYTDGAGWAYGGDRNTGFWSWLEFDFDEWDQVLLRKTKVRLKRMFKNYYFSKNLTPGSSPEEDPVKLYRENLKAKLGPAPAGLGKLPWFWPRAPNPFNAKGKLCKK